MLLVGQVWCHGHVTAALIHTLSTMLSSLGAESGQNVSARAVLYGACTTYQGTSSTMILMAVAAEPHAAGEQRGPLSFSTPKLLELSSSSKHTKVT